MVERAIDLSYLVFCWQDDAPDNAYYLDRVTGDVRLVNRHLFDLRQLTDEIEKERERYLYLPKPDRATLLEDLHEFAQSVQSAQLKRVLDVAFESPHVLSAFKKILLDDEAESERLRLFIEGKVVKRIDAWLAANSQPKSWQVDDDLLEEDELDDQEFEDDLSFEPT